MIDKQKIEDLFKKLDTYLKELTELSSLEEHEYLGNSKNIYSGRYLLQISIETCLNIGNHIISRESLGIPKDFSDIFRILYNNGILSENLLERLILMTRFRNRVVHLYWDIDDKLVLEIIKKNLNDLNEFKNSVLQHLKDSSENT